MAASQRENNTVQLKHEDANSAFPYPRGFMDCLIVIRTPLLLLFPPQPMVPYMKKEEISRPRLAYLKGFFWFAFGGTAMVSAFTLPLHIAVGGLYSGALMAPENLAMRSYFFIVTVCALYHGLYRTGTILEDLGVKRAKRAIEWCVGGVGVATTIAAGWLLYW